MIFGFALTTFFLGVSLLFWHMYPFYRQSITGDIPHYLIAVQSLVHDGDLDLANNYADPTRYAHYYSAPLAPAYAPGTERPYRGAGIPLLLTPGWLVAGHLGSLATAGLALSAAAGLLGAVALSMSGSLTVAFGMSLIVFFNLPVIAYLFFPYPDVFSGLAHLVFFLIVIHRLRTSPRPLVWVAAALLPLAGLVWMHHKFALLHPVHVLLIFLWIRPQRRWAAAGLSILFLGANLALFVWYRASHGVDLRALGADARFAPWYEAVFGMLFDKQFGIFYLFPLIALPIAEIVRQMLVGPRSRALTALALIGALYAHHAWFWGWWGGFTPSGRHTLNFLFILLYFFVPFGMRLRKDQRFLFRLVCGLFIMAHFLNVALMTDTTYLNRFLNMHPSLPTDPPGAPAMAAYEWWGRSQIFWAYGIDDHMPSLLYISGKGLRTMMISMMLVALFSLWHSWPDLRRRGRPRPSGTTLFWLLWMTVLAALYWHLHEHHQRRPGDYFRDIWGHPPSHFRDQDLP